MVTSEKKEFIYSQIIKMTFNAAFQRNPIYADADDKAKKHIKGVIETKLRSIKPRYEKCVSEKSHIHNIEYLSDDMSKLFGNYLIKGRFRIGTAQKTLNLFLKYLWCVKEIEMPPHCPIDAIIVKECPPVKNYKWTKSDSISEYKKVICAAKSVADGQPLAIWELKMYNKKWKQ